MSKPRILDLFCGAGGCSVGYERAGFDVVGVDINPQPSYPFEFWQADALEVLRSWGTSYAYHFARGFDAVHASPPCPAYSLVSGFQGVAGQHPDLIAPVRGQLDRLGRPYVIENVEGAPLRRDLVLCGEMFGLRVFRHRVFETSGFFAMQPPHSPHVQRGAKTNCETGPGVARWITGNYADHADAADAADAMGIDWPISRRELANAIPPAYTEHIGSYLLAAVERKAAA